MVIQGTVVNTGKTLGNHLSHLPQRWGNCSLRGVSNLSKAKKSVRSLSGGASFSFFSWDCLDGWGSSLGDCLAAPQYKCVCVCMSLCVHVCQAEGRRSVPQPDLASDMGRLCEPGALPLPRGGSGLSLWFPFPVLLPRVPSVILGAPGGIWVCPIPRTSTVTS